MDIAGITHYAVSVTDSEITIVKLLMNGFRCRVNTSVEVSKNVSHAIVSLYKRVLSFCTEDIIQRYKVNAKQS